MLINKVHLSCNILVLMATGSDGNESHLQQGYGGCIWGTERVTVCPHGPGATQRLSLPGTVTDQDRFSPSESRGVRSGDEDDTEVTFRPPWQQRAPAGEQELEVTQLAAHSIPDGNQSSVLHYGSSKDFCEKGAGAVAQSVSQFWRAGDASDSVRSTAGLLPISMAEFNNRRAVTTGAQRGALTVSDTMDANQREVVHYPSGQDTDNLRYVRDISRYESGLSFSSQRVNENATQPGQEHFLVYNTVGGSQTVPRSARREQQHE